MDKLIIGTLAMIAGCIGVVVNSPDNEDVAFGMSAIVLICGIILTIVWAIGFGQ